MTVYLHNSIVDWDKKAPTAFQETHVYEISTTRAPRVPTRVNIESSPLAIPEDTGRNWIAVEKKFAAPVYFCDMSFSIYQKLVDKY